MARTILIADDSPTIRKIVELAFCDTDIRVECAQGGGEALDRLSAVRPDLVLADVVMPDPSGYELCRTIKASERPVPVVLLAGTFEPFDAERARECGADGHLVKPFESDALRAKVHALLETPGEPAGPPLDARVEEVEEVEEALSVDVLPADPASAADVAPAPEAPPASEPPAGFSLEFVEAVADAVVRRLAPDVLREVALRVVPELATEIIRERIRELEQEELEEETGRG